MALPYRQSPNSLVMAFPLLATSVVRYMSLILPFHCASVLLTFPLFPVPHDVAGVGGTSVSRTNATVTSEFKIRVPLDVVVLGSKRSTSLQIGREDKLFMMALPGRMLYGVP